MRIECPDCAAAYDVPEALVATGRAVRCVRCAHGWVPRPLALPGAAPGPAPEAAPRAPANGGREAPVERPFAALLEAEAAREPGLPLHTAAPPVAPVAAGPLPAVIPPAPPASRLPVVLAWIGSVAAVAAALLALWLWRQEVIAAWPPAARLLG